VVDVDAGKESLDVVRLSDAVVEVADRRNEHRSRSDIRVDDVFRFTFAHHVRLQHRQGWHFQPNVQRAISVPKSPTYNPNLNLIRNNNSNLSY